ncbi:MAG TPA: DNA-processing protein DprA, partial [Candidatus Binataceae bacterium]|nr:DNA-processing protein DprA [Candidatus Binataceae bacterium]
MARSFVRAIVRETWRFGGSAVDAIERLRRHDDVTFPSERAARSELAAIERLGIAVIDARDGTFPALLREIPDAPLALFVRGDASTLTAPLSVAVIGSRRASAAGNAFASALAQDLARAGIAVVSGLARGIDGAAHRGALDGGGATVAVMGGGHTRLYPPSHRSLANRIVEAGALVCEYPPSAAPLPANFPERNRIISGLCAAVVIIEARRHSGTSITARMALEQGRDVMAVPGSVGDGLHSGCHRLIRQGALLVEGIADVLEGLGLTAPAAAVARSSDPLHARVLD